MTNIGVVAIGRNEGERLRACLVAALPCADRVVYVDSGSSDGSVELARSLGAEVVELDLSIPFTAARARNAGFARLMELDPGIEFVQFVDGDCELVQGWVERAKREMEAKSQAAVVCGRRRERFPDETIFNKLCDIEWDTPVGSVKYCGGDALVRVSAFREVGGYDGRVIAGEEPEMCVRLRARGWMIERIDAEMTLHDAAMTRPGQWWKRHVRAGHAYAEGYAMHGGAPEFHRRRELRSIIAWGIVLPMVIVVMLIVLLLAAPQWVWLMLAPVMLYLMLAVRVAWRLRARLGRRDALIYAASVVLAKFPQALGVLKYYMGRMSGRRSGVIEYKGPAVTVK